MRLKYVLIIVILGLFVNIANSQEIVADDDIKSSPEENIINEDGADIQLNQTKDSDIPDYTKPIIISMGLGFLLQISGVFVSIEANRRFVKASATYAKYQASNDDSSILSRYEEEKLDYQIFAYTGIGLFGLGTVGVGFGVFYIIKQMQILNSRLNKEIETKKDVGFSQIPIGSSNTYLFMEPYKIGIGVK